MSASTTKLTSSASPTVLPINSSPSTGTTSSGTTTQQPPASKPSTSNSEVRSDMATSDSVVQKTALGNIKLCKNILSFLPVSEVGKAERVSQGFRKAVNDTNLWELLCFRELNIPRKDELDPNKRLDPNEHLDPFDFLPLECGRSFKKGAIVAEPVVYNARTYRRIGAEIGNVPPIPDDMPLTLSKGPDPEVPSLKFGREWVWIYAPENYEIVAGENGRRNFYLLPQKKEGETARLMKNENLDPTLIKLGVQHIRIKSLTVPNSILNIATLFAYPKQGNRSLTMPSDPEVHSLVDKRTPVGWFCIRKRIPRKGLSMLQFHAAAKKAKVSIANLDQVVLLNVNRKATAKNNTYALAVGEEAVSASQIEINGPNGRGTFNVGCKVQDSDEIGPFLDIKCNWNVNNHQGDRNAGAAVALSSSKSSV